MTLKQPSREREYSLRRDEYVSVTTQDIKDALWFALKDMRELSYYGPMIDRYPVMVDEGMPNKAMRMLKEHDSPACTDSNNVYFSTEIFIKNWNEWQSRVTDRDANWSLVDNIAALLAHEYTHVLCQHNRIGQEYENKSAMEQHCHIIACEIEANRGHMVKNSENKHGYWSHSYGQRNVIHYVGVTDEQYPETKNDKYYPQIYATLLNNAKKYQKQMEQAMSMIKDLFASMGMEGNEKSLQKASKNASKAGSGSGKGMGIKISQKGAENENDNQGQAPDESQGNKDNSNEMGNALSVNSVNRQQNENKSESENSEWNLTQEEIEKSIQNAMKVQQTIVKEQAPGSEAGYGLESPYIEYKPELTQQEMLEADYGRWHQAEVKKELAKLKGLIRGTISKNRESTYARPTRRPISGSGGLIKKGVRYEKSYSPKVLIAMDSSGSMCSTTMKEVACAIENIFKDLGKPKVGSYICKHESNVSDVKPMFRWKEVVESYYPSGGNCFAHVVEEANKLGVDVVLNIGDGQDTITRSGYSESAVAKFKNANRKWFDVLVTDKGENRYYREESEYDENNGFHREGIYLGNKISKYLN